MNKKTQMIIGIAAVGVAAYFLLKNKNKDKVFANLRGPGTPLQSLPQQGTLGPNRPAEACSSGSCVDGRCTISQYGPNGQVMSTAYYACTGSGNDIRVQQLVTTGF
jgi:hypothetical protein